ncbi:MAG: aldehyde dehydrogenase family protein, partial [Candidatus Dormibacteria bacterium]
MIIPPFRNEPSLDFSQAANRRDFEAALRLVHDRLGRSYPLLIGGSEVATDSWVESFNPAHPGELVGRHAAAGREQVELAVAAGWAAFAEWSRTPVEERAELLLRAAQVIRRRRHELGALMVYEVGKPWDEADGEAAEAVDLMEWYARQALELPARDRMAPSPGEITQFRYL